MFKKFVQRHWGLLILTISTLASFIQIWRTKHWLHYRIFSGAARELWSGRNPYFNDYGTNLGYWYYSPSCGLYFFGPFASLPDRFGIYAYMLSSVALFIGGVHYFLNSLENQTSERKEFVARLREPWLNLFWFWISFELMSGIVATKLEVAMAGILFFAVGSLLRGQVRPWSPFLFAMIVNWKFQPIPVFGLLTFFVKLA